MAQTPIPADPTQDPTQSSGDPSQGQSQNQGYTICIAVDADDTIAVGVVPGTDMDQDGDNDAQPDQGGGDDDDNDFAPASGIKDALAKALQIFKNGGQPPETGDSDADQMASGYGADQS